MTSIHVEQSAKLFVRHCVTRLHICKFLDRLLTQCLIGIRNIPYFHTMVPCASALIELNLVNICEWLVLAT